MGECWGREGGEGVVGGDLEEMGRRHVRRMQAVHEAGARNIVWHMGASAYAAMRGATGPLSKRLSIFFSHCFQ